MYHLARYPKLFANGIRHFHVRSKMKTNMFCPQHILETSRWRRAIPLTAEPQLNQVVHYSLQGSRGYSMSGTRSINFSKLYSLCGQSKTMSYPNPENQLPCSQVYYEKLKNRRLWLVNSLKSFIFIQLLAKLPYHGLRAPDGQASVFLGISPSCQYQSPDVSLQPFVLFKQDHQGRATLAAPLALGWSPADEDGSGGCRAFSLASVKCHSENINRCFQLSGEDLSRISNFLMATRLSKFFPAPWPR
ncbi:hypothetical protein QBC35DRAFT_293600 [Podospora australis]|uniref:Uncharacterized protein n=1 Tax=Podospora australis TaxID=1536484 RepID=A0AAN6X2C3_9PEZI|nr:hypothetical protein QBC35DRAFT_293600 [Podospora australis]